jgi:peptidyl-dipeptidase A
LISKDLLEQITQNEANLCYIYSNFRPTINGRKFTENEIRGVLKNESDVNTRKEVWEGSKEIGKTLAPYILELVHLRNEAAKSIGYSDYFSMQLELQEVDQDWLFETLDDLAERSEAAHSQLIDEIYEKLSVRFNVPKEEIGPWAWSEPFSQEDPLEGQALDAIVKDLDYISAVTDYYQKMNFDVVGILNRSDIYERPGKDQHAFCAHIDREGDVRTLNNIKPTIRWLETLFHEIGHAVYELGYDPQMPWLLKMPPHMITTEAMALLMGRQVYRAKSLEQLGVGSDPSVGMMGEESLRRRQLVFSRWVLVMTHFERELYRNPDQNLNQLWWNLVEKYQKIKSPESIYGCDWASKVHIGLAPVYYYSYLLGELFASTLEEKLVVMQSPESGEFLNEMVFKPGNSLSWNELIKHATGEKLSPAAWLSQFTGE